MHTGIWRLWISPTGSFPTESCLKDMYYTGILPYGIFPAVLVGNVPVEFYPQFRLEMSPRKCPHTRKRKCPHRNCLYRKRPRIDERNFPRRNSHYRNSPYRNLVVTNWMENSRAKRVFCFVYIRSTFNWLTAWFAIITFLVTLILFQALKLILTIRPKPINKRAYIQILNPLLSDLHTAWFAIITFLVTLILFKLWN